MRGMMILSTDISTTIKRGFAAMSADERSRIASLGGKAAHQKGTAHRFTKEEAAAAGSIGRKKKQLIEIAAK
jgi:hypothetical protein